MVLDLKSVSNYLEKILKLYMILNYVVLAH